MNKEQIQECLDILIIDIMFKYDQEQDRKLDGLFMKFREIAEPCIYETYSQYIKDAKLIAYEKGYR